jgi:hypothetical protein
LSNKRFYSPEKKRRENKRRKRKERKKRRREKEKKERVCSLCFYFDSGGVL